MFLKLIIRRVITLVPLLGAVAIGSFLLVRLAPGDYFSEISANPHISRETLSGLRELYGLDRPWHNQFISWLAGMFTGNFGYSIAYNRSAGSLIGERITNTVFLSISSLVLTIIVSLPMGLFAARRKGGWFDRILLLLSTMTLSTPSLLLALLALVFAARSGWFPVGGVSSTNMSALSTGAAIADYLHHLILPASVLSLRLIPDFYRQIRSSLLEAYSNDFIIVARAKGLPESTILIRHALRNSIGPTITMMGNSLGTLLSGAFIVEVVMSWPGLGELTVNSLLSRDPYLLTSCLVFAAILLASGNLITDILLIAADPRLRRANQL